MRLGQYQEVDATLSSATISRLEQGNPFNKRRIGQQAIAVIEIAVNTMYPPRTPEEWKDRSRYQGTGRHVLLLWYDLVCYLVRRLVGRNGGFATDAGHVVDEAVQITLKIPLGLLHWIEKIAGINQSTIPEATVYAIEYGLRVLDSQEGSEAGLRRVWRDIFQTICKRIVKVDRI
jgi:hypothetical protein